MDGSKKGEDEHMPIDVDRDNHGIGNAMCMAGFADNAKKLSELIRTAGYTRDDEAVRGPADPNTRGNPSQRGQRWPPRV